MRQYKPNNYKISFSSRYNSLPSFFVVLFYTGISKFVHTGILSE